MKIKIKSNPNEQMRAEKKRFEARQRHKPVLAEKIKAREKIAKKNGEEKVFMEDLQF